MKKILSLFIAFVVVCICYFSPVTINADAASASDLTFELGWEGTYYCLSECSREASGEIVVPETYNGLPVTQIGSGVYDGFAYCSSITSVILPKTIVDIHQGAFSECTSLKKIEIPNGVESIGSSAFSYCVSLESVVIPETTTWIGDWVFYGCKKLSSVYIPSSVGTIGRCSFGYYDNANGQREKVSGFIIYGKSGSVAEEYAVENGFKFEEPKVEIKLSTPKVTIKNTAKGIKVTWNAIENAENYVVYRRVYNASTKKWGGWSKLKTGITATSYTDATVKLGTKYRYTVRAVNGSVMSAYKTTSTLKYNVTPTVKAANTSTGIKVSWSTVANATGYTVYSSTYNAKTKKWSGWTNRGTTKATTTSWVDKKAKSGTKYKYTVRAVNGKVLSFYDKTGATTLYLTQPTVKIANASTGVKVSWNKVTGATGYTVYRSELSNGKWTDWKKMGTAKAEKKSWVDKSAESGVQYKYTVRAINGNYKSTYKASASLLYLAQPKVTVKNTDNGIKVNWTQCAGAQGYIVYRSKYDAVTKKWSSWRNMGTKKSEEKSWVDVNVISGEKYKYTVRAVNGNVKSTFVASSVLKCLITEINSSNAKTVFVPLIAHYRALNQSYHDTFSIERINGYWNNKELLEACYRETGINEYAISGIIRFKTVKNRDNLISYYKRYLSSGIINASGIKNDRFIFSYNNSLYAVYGAKGSYEYDANSILYLGKKDGGYLISVNHSYGTEEFLLKFVNETGQYKIVSCTDAANRNEFGSEIANFQDATQHYLNKY